MRNSACRFLFAFPSVFISLPRAATITNSFSRNGTAGYEKVRFLKGRLFLLSLFCTVICQSVLAQLSITCPPDIAVCGSQAVNYTLPTATGTAASLGTTTAAGNNHAGNMFNLTAVKTLTITSFDAHPMGNTTIAIYYKTGSHAGFESNAAAWTLIGSAAVVAQPMGTLTPVPVPVNITIPAGQTYAFYITSANTTTRMNYSNGTTAGAVYSQDVNLKFMEGVGLEYPFTGGTGGFNTPRVWNGRIHYTLSTTLQQTAGLASGSTFPVGTTVNTFKATDADGNSTNCSFNVTVNALPTVNTVANQVLCTGTATTPVAFTGTLPGTVYNWTNDNSSIGLAASGTGDIASFTAVNTTTSVQTANVTVTPVRQLTNETFNYTGGVQTWTVPAGVTSVNIKAWGAQGGSGWANNTNFGGYAEGTLSVTPGEVLSIYVGGQPTGIAGGFNGGGNGEGAGRGGGGASDIRRGGVALTNRVLVASGGGGASFWSGQEVVGGVGGGLTGGDGYRDNPSNPGGKGATQTASGTGTCTSFNNPAVSGGFGFGGSVSGCGCEGYGGGGGWYGGAGSGNCRGGGGGSSYIDGVSNGVTTAGLRAGHGTVIINYALPGDCSGTPQTFTITVNPNPEVDAIADQTVCNGSQTTAIAFTSAMAGTSYSWTNSNTAIGLAASGSGSLPAFTAVNTGSAPITATITVTPSITTGGVTCSGTAKTFTITVNPTPGFNTAGFSNSICNNQGIALMISNGGTLPGSTYTWTNSNTAIGLAASGSGNTISFTGTNTGNTVINGTITVTPEASGCTGLPQTFTIAVKPTPTVNAVANQTVCDNSNTTAIAFTGTVSGTTFSWTNSNPAIGLAASGTGDIPAFLAVNTGASAITATITVTPTTNGCTGAPQSFTLTILPRPLATISGGSFCRTGTQQLIVTSGTTGGSFTAPAGLSINASGLINLASSTPGTYTVTYSFTNGTCNNTATSSVTVNALPVATITGGSYCASGTQQLAVTSGPAGGNFSAPAGLAISTSGLINLAASTPGTYTVTYTFSNGTCTSTTTASVTVTELPEATISGTATVCQNSVNPNITFAASKGTAPYTFTYKVNGGPDQTITTSASSATVTVPVSTATAGTFIYTLVSVREAGANTCTNAATGSATITVNTMPAASFSYVGTPFCSGTGTKTPTFSGTAGGTFTSTTGLSINSATGAINIGTSSPGTYTITYTVPASGNCPQVQATTSITINPIVTFAIASSGPLTICEGGSVTLSAPTAAGNTYLWSNGATTSSINVTDAGNYSVSVISGGCISTGGPIVVNKNPVPTVNAIADQTLCNGSNATVVSFSGAVPGATYNWTNSNTAIGLAASGTGDIASFTANNTGTSPIISTITVTPVFTNGGVSCAGPSRSFTITVYPTPKVTSAASGTICNNTAQNYNISSGVSGTTYTWSRAIVAGISNPSVSGQTQATITETLVNTTNAPIDVVYTIVPSANGCTGPAFTYTVTVNPHPDVTAIVNQTICNNGATAAINFAGNIPGATYTWSNTHPAIGLAGSGTGNIGSFTAVNTGSTPVTATITVTPSFNGCPGSSRSFTITVNPTPVVNTLTNLTVCEGVNIASIPFTGTGVTSYSWTNNHPAIGLAASGTGPIPAFTSRNTTNAPVTATITVTPVYTNNGVSCNGNAKTFTITVNPVISVNAIADQTVCNGSMSNAIVFNGPVAGTVYHWTNSNPGIGLAASGTGNLPVFRATNAGSTPVVATISVTPSFINNGVVCTGAAKTFIITVNPTPAVHVIADKAYCSESVTPAIPVTGLVSGSTYRWTNSNPAIGLAATGTGTIPSFKAVNPSNSSVTATITVTPEANGCIGTPVSFVITIHPLPKGQVQTPDGVLLCPGTPLRLTVSGGISYQWYLNGGTALTGETNATYSATQPGTYTASITSAAGCVNMASNSVTVSAITRPTADFDFRNYCENVPVSFINNSASAHPVDYTWTFDVNKTSNQKNPVYTFTEAGAYTVDLKVRPLGCDAEAVTVSRTLNIESPVPAVRLSQVNVFPNNPTEVQGRILPGASYLWSPGSLFTGSVRIVNPLVRTAQRADLQIRMDFPSGCVTTDSVLVHVVRNEDVDIPNTFSPNGDGIHDVWDVPYLKVFKDCIVEVYNRYGQLIFKSVGYTSPWNGTFKGSPLPVGTYYYVIDLKNGYKKVAGSVTIIK